MDRFVRTWQVTVNFTTWYLQGKVDISQNPGAQLKKIKKDYFFYLIIYTTIEHKALPLSVRETLHYDTIIVTIFQ